MRRLVTGLLAGGLLLIGTPAVAAPPARPVALVVGLRTATDLAAKVDVLDSTALGGGAVAIDVPADQVTEAAATLRADPAVRYVEPDHVAQAAAVIPDDPGYRAQWGVPKTRVNQAWSVVRGSGVTVAVVDTGVAALPDFAGRLLPGYDFVNGDHNAADDNGHGTMAAGVIAAAGDNGTGIAGICWLCRILPVKVLDSHGGGSYSTIAEGIRYAADHHADIINLSLGGPDDSQLLRDAVAYAVAEGSLVIAAAGNAGGQALHFPAAIPAVLAVGASAPGDARYPWSNYGSSWVDVAAPGCNPAQGRNGVIGSYCGTSSATPFTCGVAALLASASPAPGPAAIRAALTSSAVPLPGNWAGAGRIDAAAALEALPFWVTGVRSGVSVGDRFAVTPHVGAGITRVTAALDGVEADAATRAPWTLDVDTSRVTGPATITISAYAGSTQRAVATYPVVADHARPTLSFRSPRPSALVRGSLSIVANAADNVAVSRVQLLAGSRVLGTDLTAPYAFTWHPGPAAGPVTVTLSGYDRAGNVTSSKRTFVVATRPRR
jgi:subtilisin family serine protease